MLLSDWLAKRDVKRKDFAARIGVSPSLVTALCNGSVWPGREVAEKIIAETGGEVTADDFVRKPASCGPVA